MNAVPTPQFARGFRLRHDRVRDQWVVLGPERAFVADDVAAEILRRVDGVTPLEAIIAALAALYDAPREVIAADVLAMVQHLSERGVLIV